MNNGFYLGVFFIISLFTNCKGQSNPKPVQAGIDTAMQSYLKQKDRFEFKDYKMYYNGQLIKADTLKNIYKIFGRAFSDTTDIAYNTKPLWLLANFLAKRDKSGRKIYIYDGKIVTDYKKYDTTMLGGMDWFENDGTPVAIVRSFRIQMLPYNAHTSIKDRRDSIMEQIPTLNGYVLVNGVLVNKSTPVKEIIHKMGKINNGHFVSMLGTPVLIYYPAKGHSFSEYDAKKDLSDDAIYIEFLYTKDKPVGENEIYSINYYYTIK